ncbi:coiled-coil domain-containing protein 40 [Cheilinus undulatus]|uniref:coiled-coil domain-containing protein 40 n=1 Tax=Cheilinus undulatus TaxID=241271 RepID=UPI001BD1D7F9|nr:coiled-coil domain-containing protein 40 [Cheilinus undulatus]
MESNGQNDNDSKTQDGEIIAVEDCGATSPPAQEGQPGPEQDATTLHTHSDHSGTDDYITTAAFNSVLENVPQVPLIPGLSNLNESGDMDDHDPLPEEEEEFIVLDPEHPLYKRYQAALNIQLMKQLERLNQAVEEKVVREKHNLEVQCEMYKVQEQLARAQARLEDRNHSKDLAEAKLRQALDQLEVMKAHYSSVSRMNSEAKAKVSKQQAELDKLMAQVVFTQGVSEDLHSNVKVMKNARRKAGDDKNQAEEQKLKQDKYVKRLTEELERVTQQGDMYDAQASAQAEETKRVKEALSKAQMEVESLAMTRKQLLQQWNSSLVELRRRDEAFSAMQEAMGAVTDQGILLDREIDGYKKSVTEEQEQNEILTMQLNWSQMECDTLKNQISQKQAQQDVLQARYTTCLRTLNETEHTHAMLSKEASTLQTEVNDQRKQLEKESAVRLELEDKIMTHMQQKLTHTKDAKYSQRLTSKTAALKREKVSQLCQLENNIAAVDLETTEVIQHLDCLALIQEALDEEITKSSKILTTSEKKASSLLKLVEQRETSITNCNKKIDQIIASTGHEDLSPQQIKIEELKSQNAELEASITRVKQFWRQKQEILEELIQKIETNSRKMFKLQQESTRLQKEKICLESQLAIEHREETELDKDTKMLKRDLLKLNTLIGKNAQLSVSLEQENELMETDFMHRLKDAERECTEMQMKYEKTQEENETLLNCLLEVQQQIMLWEKKIQILKETRSIVNRESQGEVQEMKAEIRRMEIRLDRLMKQRERLLKESEATVTRRENLVLRREAMVYNPSKQREKNRKGDLERRIQGLQRKVRDTHKKVGECDQEIRNLEESKVSLSNRITQQEQKLEDLRRTNFDLEHEIVHLQDTKDCNLYRLVALQGRAKKLQQVKEGTFRAVSRPESIDAPLQRGMERVHAVNTIVHRVCQESPQHQGALRRLSLSLAANIPLLEKEMS